MKLDYNPRCKTIELTPENEAEQHQLKAFYDRHKFINLKNEIEYDFCVSLIEGNWGLIVGLSINTVMNN